MPTVRDIATALEEWAPIPTKLDFDRVGLQVGDPAAEVTSVLVALDCTAQAIAEAEQVGAQLLVTHHPLLFRAVGEVTSTHAVGGLAYRMARSGISYYAIHTNLDVAAGGVSFALAKQLGIDAPEALEPSVDTSLKLVTFVPQDATDAVREALANAGAARIGEYEECSFELRGTGTFRPTSAANPTIGEAGGGLERVDETRLEVELPRWRLAAVLTALHEAHPYEEVAHDIYEVKQPSTQFGLGAVGDLASPMSLSDFLARVSEALNAPTLRFCGDEEEEIRRVAVCGGAGADLISAARRARADVFVTSDITYHRFFETLDLSGNPTMALVDAGHYETEWITEVILTDYLRERFPGLDVSRVCASTSPMRHFSRNQIR